MKKAKAKSPGPQEETARKVLIVDDHPMMRRALTEVMATESDLTVAGETGDANTAVHLAGQLQPDGAVIDLRLEAGHGIEVIEGLCEQRPGIACLVYSMLEETHYAQRVIDAGGLGFLNKRAPADQIVEALRTILQGHVYLSQDVASRLLRQDRCTAEETGAPLGFQDLTGRELSVFQSIGEGKTISRIAGQLSISPKTVDVHRQHIKGKLGVTDNAHLMRLAVEWITDNT